MSREKRPISSLYHLAGDGYEYARSPVVSLEDFRLRRGIGTPDCRHRRLVYCDKNRLIHCEDCEEPIDAFEAFLIVARTFHAMEDRHLRREQESQARLDKAEKLIAAKIHRVAARNLDREWARKDWAVACPVCGEGLLAEDFKTIGGGMNKNFALARRAKKRGS